MGWWHLCFGDGYIETLIIYGRVTNPDTVAVGIINKSRDDRVLLSENHALLSPETPGLRFSSSGWFDLRSVGQLEINTFELLLAITKEKILSRISPFSIIIRIFVERYIEFLCEQTNKINKTPPEKEIFGSKDWVFSGWLPIPHPQILLSNDLNLNKMSFIEFDICFWTGHELICLYINKRNTKLKSEQKKIDFLIKKNVKIRIITIPEDKIKTLDSKFPSDLFNNSFLKYWDELDLPHGPSPPNF